jgi:hypothetical protein
MLAVLLFLIGSSKELRFLLCGSLRILGSCRVVGIPFLGMGN